MIRLSFLLLLVVFGCSSSQKESGAIELADLRLTDLAGSPVDLDQYKNKTVLVNVWATWCRPCLQEMPTLAGAQATFSNEPIVFLFASNETLKQIEGFKQRQKFDFNYLHLNNQEELGILALPTTFIFNKEGELKFSEAGYRNWVSDESTQLISSILNDTK